MKRNPTAAEARQVFEQRYASDRANLHVNDTGLKKVCPRCGRAGWVFLFSYGADIERRAAIVWEGAARGGAKPADIDTCRPEEMFRPTFGCGLDKSERG